MAISTSTLRLVALATGAALLAGCATKDFGRVESTPLTGMSCDQLAAEQGKVEAFRAAIDKKDNVDLRSIAGFGLDFGLGNHIDKKKALHSADDRQAQIAEARQAQGCA